MLIWYLKNGDSIFQQSKLVKFQLDSGKPTGRPREGPGQPIARLYLYVIMFLKITLPLDLRQSLRKHTKNVFIYTFLIK